MFLNLYTDKGKRNLIGTAFFKADGGDGKGAGRKPGRLRNLSFSCTSSDEQENDVRSFIREIRRYAAIQELDETVLNRLINPDSGRRINKVDGEKVQEVKIIYNFVGENTGGAIMIAALLPFREKGFFRAWKSRGFYSPASGINSDVQRIAQSHAHKFIAGAVALAGQFIKFLLQFLVIRSVITTDLSSLFCLASSALPQTYPPCYTSVLQICNHYRRFFLTFIYHMIEYNM